MFIEDEVEILKVDTEAVRIRLMSEPYVVCNSFGYQPAIDIWHIKKKRAYRLYLSARSLATQLEQIRSNNGLTHFTGIEFWINKVSDQRTSPYVVSE